jgi:hypothetical protein
MKTTLILLLATLALPGCRDNTKLSGEQKTYEVVEEGAASGVAGTIGEAAVPLTGTNADTTTAFQLPMTATTASTDPGAGALAGTIPDPYTTTPAQSAPGTSAGYIRRSAPPPAATRAPEPVTAEVPRPAEGGLASGATGEPAADAEAGEQPARESPAETEPPEDEPAPATETTSTQPPTVF